MADLSTAPSRFSIIQPELLPRMQVLESVSTEQIISNRMAQLVTIWASKDPPNAAQYDVGALEFDPIKINQELNANFELNVRDRINQGCRAVTLAFGFGSNLDAIASRYPGGVPRLTDETDAHYRKRVWLSVNPLSRHGVPEGYQFWALTALDGYLRDASTIKIRRSLTDTPTILVTALSPSPLIFATDKTVPPTVRRSIITVDPKPATSTLLQILTFIQDPSRIGITDVVVVDAPKVMEIDYSVKVWFYPGPETQVLLDQIKQKLDDLVIAQYMLGYDHTRASISAAASTITGIYNVEVVSPETDIFVPPDWVVKVNSIKVEYAGRRE